VKTRGVAAVIGCAVVALAGLSGAAQTEILPGRRGAPPPVPVFDGHNDYPWEVRQKAQFDLDKLDISGAQPATMTDIPRLRAGGVGGQFWSVYVPAALAGQAAVTATMEQIDIVHRMMRKYPQAFELALTAGDVERIFKAGKIASLVGMEGGHSIDNSLGALRMFHRLGAHDHPFEERPGADSPPTCPSTAA
jgi:membrane dipeptidase